MASQKHTVYDLERESGIKARTIRKYIQMGLVPQAETRGPGPAYTDDHLSRLKVVELLRAKNRSLTLDKIRLILQQLSPEDIQAIASGSAQVGALVDTDEQESTALEYIRSLRGKSADKSEPLLSKQMAIPSMSIEQSDERDRERDETKQTTVEQIVDALEQLSGKRSSPRSVRTETWQRIEVTPDIELSIRGDFDEEQRAQFHRVADLLRYLLARGVK